MQAEPRVPQLTLETLSAPFTSLAISLIELGTAPAAAMKLAARKCPAGQIAFDKLQRQKADAKRKR